MSSEIKDKPEENEEDEVEAEIVQAKEEEFPWAADDDEKRRSFVFVQMSDSSGSLSIAEIDGKILVENMEHITKWLKEAIVPVTTSKTPKHLRVTSDAGSKRND